LPMCSNGEWYNMVSWSIGIEMAIVWLNGGNIWFVNERGRQMIYNNQLALVIKQSKQYFDILEAKPI